MSRGKWLRSSEGLSPQHYAVMALREEGFLLKQVAYELKVPIGTVKSRIHQANKFLSGHNRSGQLAKFKFFQQGITPEMNAKLQVISKQLSRPRVCLVREAITQWVRTYENRYGQIDITEEIEEVNDNQ
jgi:predicted DNA-binding protein